MERTEILMQKLSLQEKHYQTRLTFNLKEKNAYDKWYD